MASIRKRVLNGEARWDVTVTRRGAPRQTRTFQTRAAAERWARETERDIERGAWRSTAMAERTTVGELLKRYREEVLPAKRSAKSLQMMIDRVIRSDLARLPVIALTPELVAKYRDARLRMHATNGGPYGREQPRLISTQTVRHEMGLLKRAINHAMREWGLHLPAGNPAALVRLPPPAKARDRRAEGNEYQRLLQLGYASRTRNLGHAIEFAVETAMRRGEICNLEWRDIDLKRRVARARETKNGEPRDVPLSSSAIAVLRSMPRPLHGGSVFGLTGPNFTQAFKRLCVRLGIENLRLHDLRHEATSRLAERLQGDVMALSAITGHKTLGMLKRYTHLKPEDIAKRLA
jgi:integrase